MRPDRSVRLYQYIACFGINDTDILKRDGVSAFRTETRNCGSFYERTTVPAADVADIPSGGIGRCFRFLLSEGFFGYCAGFDRVDGFVGQLIVPEEFIVVVCAGSFFTVQFDADIIGDVRIAHTHMHMIRRAVFKPGRVV